MALPPVLLEDKLPLSERVDLAMEACRAKGMRRTRTLRVIMEVLVEEPRPVCWATLTAQVRRCLPCDPSSVFRILARLETLAIIRRLSAARRSSYFALNVEGRIHDQIVCSVCNSVEIPPIDQSLGDYVDLVRAKTGYRVLSRQLTFFGVCPACQAHLEKPDVGRLEHRSAQSGGSELDGNVPEASSAAT